MFLLFCRAGHFLLIETQGETSAHSTYSHLLRPITWKIGPLLKPINIDRVYTYAIIGYGLLKLPVVQFNIVY